MTDNTHTDKRRLAKNTIFSLISWVFPILVGFVATPILVKGLGAEQYGILAIILGFLSYSFTFGTGKVVAKFIPEYRAVGQDEKISAVVFTTFWFSLSIALIGSLSVALFANYIVSDILLIPNESRYTATTALYLACGAGLVMMVSQTFQFTMQGLHRFGSYVVLTNLNGLLLGVGNILLVFNGFGVVAILCWNLTIALFTGLLFFIQAQRLLPDLRLKFRIDKSLFTAVAKYGGNIILFQIFGNALYIFERTWVVRKFGSQELTFYSVPMLLALYLHGFVGGLTQATFPVVNELLNDKNRLISLYQKATKIILAVVVFVGIIFICAGKLFLSLWVSPELAANSYNLLIIHTLTFMLIALAIMTIQIGEAFKFSAITPIITATWMLIAIPLMIFVADVWHSEGIAMSRLIATVATTPLIFFVEKKFLGAVFYKFWLLNVFRILLGAIAMAVPCYLIISYFPASWITLLFGICVGSLSFVGVLLLSGYISRVEKDFLCDLVFRRNFVVATHDSQT
jgi:O-antigen/teichoic acid export membrane protein